MGNNKRKTNQSKTPPTKTTLLSDILPLPDPKFHGCIGNDLRVTSRSNTGRPTSKGFALT
jgi:hypothetical protein